MARYDDTHDVIDRLKIATGDAAIPLPTAPTTEGMKQAYLDADGKLWKA